MGMYSGYGNPAVSAREVTMTANLMRPVAPGHAATRCPGCGSSHTAWVDTVAQDNVLCRTCGACWHPAAGHLERVSPQRCPGCALRRVCLAANG